MKPYQGDLNDCITKNAYFWHDDGPDGLMLRFSNRMGRQRPACRSQKGRSFPGQNTARNQSRCRCQTRGDGATALMAASTTGHLAVVQALLAAKADVNARMTNGATALMAAAAVGNRQVVRALLDAGADVDAKANDGLTALLIASEDGFPADRTGTACRQGRCQRQYRQWRYPADGGVARRIPDSRARRCSRPGPM